MPECVLTATFVFMPKNLDSLRGRKEIGMCKRRQSSSHLSKSGLTFWWTNTIRLKTSGPCLAWTHMTQHQSLTNFSLDMKSARLWSATKWTWIRCSTEKCKESKAIKIICEDSWWTNRDGWLIWRLRLQHARHLVLKALLAPTCSIQSQVLTEISRLMP